MSLPWLAGKNLQIQQQLFANCTVSITAIVEPIKQLNWWEFCLSFSVQYVNDHKNEHFSLVCLYVHKRKFGSAYACNRNFHLTPATSKPIRLQYL